MSDQARIRIFSVDDHPLPREGIAAIINNQSDMQSVASGILLLIGFLTKAACVVVGLTGVGVALSWVPVRPLNSFDTQLAMILVIILAAAMILLGPGAYSLDARLLGRREIIIPPSSHPPYL